MPIIRLKELHAAQRQIMQESKRFNVLKCGRRFGKTILTENLSIEPALEKKFVGYWTPTYKDVSKVWDEVKFILHPIIKRKDEQLKQIRLITGGKIDFWSMEDPNSGRGFSYHRAIIDEGEKARHLKEAWNQVIRPTLTDYRGDAWILSTPQFGQTYFKELTKLKDKPGFEDWQSWTKTTYDNPHISKDEIDSARAQLDELTFRCEFMAEDVDRVGKPFAYAFSEAKHVGNCPENGEKYNEDKEILLGFDFNASQMACVAAQLYDDRIEYIKEFTLPNSNTYELCNMIHAYFPNAVFIVTGDATGRNRSALAQGNINHYDVIKQKLSLVETQIQSPSINPHVSDRQTLLNSVLQNFRVIFDRDNCPLTIRDMKYVEIKENGDIDKDRSTDTRLADHIDAASYIMCTFMSNFIKYNRAEFEA